MENLNTSHLFLSRTEAQTNELHQNINKLIDELGQKMQNQLIAMQQKILLKYKTNLEQAQQNYRNLHQNRNDEVIQHNVSVMKCQHQQTYHQSSQKAMQINKIYDKLKLDLKKNCNYERQLQLEIQFLNKQCKNAKKKGQMLDEEIKQYEEKKRQRDNCNNSQPNAKATQSVEQTDQLLTNCQSHFERRLKNKIQYLKDFLQQISHQSTFLQKILSKYDLNSYSTQRQKIILINKVFEDTQFKKYLYHVLFDSDSPLS